jgi:hypothetical protein
VRCRKAQGISKRELHNPRWLRLASASALR